MHKSPFKNATWLSLMLGLSRNLLSIRQGPGDHNPSDQIGGPKKAGMCQFLSIHGITSV